MDNIFSKYSVRNPYDLKLSGSDDHTCTLRFLNCDNDKPLWDLNKKELKAFIRFAKKVEALKWKEIKQDKGLKFEVLKGFKMPNILSKDIIFTSMRFSDKARIIGYREEEYYYIIWFDNNHEYNKK